MREGSNSMTVCQPMVMMLVWPFQAELTSTTGPGSRKRRIWETGRCFLGEAFMDPSGRSVVEVELRDGEPVRHPRNLRLKRYGPSGIGGSSFSGSLAKSAS